MKKGGLECLLNTCKAPVTQNPNFMGILKSRSFKGAKGIVMKCLIELGGGGHRGREKERDGIQESKEFLNIVIGLPNR